MPLVRFAVRNEYGLGVPELYKDAVQEEDPKAVLEGVTVAGLVGILRQLGDLAEFAAEVFHGLQEQVASTASRSRKLGTRVQRIEASMPQLEKAILSQTSHIHFAYTPGTEWHPRIRNEQNHFIYDDLSHYIMDSYEECREPPRLQLLDRFDAGGPGSCLKRYSDPAFFKRASASSEIANGEKPRYEKKARKNKRRRSSQRSGSVPNYTPAFSGRMHLSSTGQRQSPLSHAGSACDMSFRSGKVDQSDSLCSKDGMDFIECVFYSSTSIPHNNTETTESSSGHGGKILDTKESVCRDEQTAVSATCNPDMETTVPHSSSTTCDKKLELLQPMDIAYRIDDIQDAPKTTFNLYEQDSKPIPVESRNQVDDLSEYGSTPRSIVSDYGPKATAADMQGVSKANFDLDEAEMRPIGVEKVNQADDLSECGSIPEPNVHGRYPETIIDRKFMELTGSDCMIDEALEMLQRNFQPHDHSLEPANMADLTQVREFSAAENTLGSITKGELLHCPIDSKLGRGEVQCVLDTNSDVAELDSGTINTEQVSQVETFCEGENTVTVIEWPQFDDIDSETDNFVDALNMIESESESDFECQTRKAVELSPASNDGVEDTMIKEHKALMISDQEYEEENPSASDNYKEEIADDLPYSQALVPSTGIESLECAQSSCNKSAAEGWKLDDSAVDGSQHSTASLPSATVLSLEHAQSYCSELAVVQGQKLDDSMCLFDDGYGQSNKSSSAYIEYPEHGHSSFSKSAAEGQCLDDSACMFDYLQCSTASLSSGNILSLENAQSSGSSVAVVQGQELDDATCLPDDSEGSFDDSRFSAAASSSAAVVCQEPVRSSCEQLAIPHSQKLDDSTCLLNEPSMTSNNSSSADFESLEQAESSCNESAAEGQEMDHREGLFDDTQGSTASLPSATITFHEHAKVPCSESKAVQGPKLDDSTCFFDEQLVECPKSSSAPNTSERIVFSDRRPVLCEIAASSSQACPKEGTSQNSQIPQEMPVGFSSTSPLAFWTNGNLLGLAPSKPTVLSASSSVDSAPMNSGNDITVGQFNQNIAQRVNDSARTQALSPKDSECSGTKEAKMNTFDQDFGSLTYKSDQISDKKHGTTLHHDRLNLTDLCFSQGLTNGHVIPLETKGSSSVGVKNVSAELTNKSEDNSSLLSFLGRGLLKNSLRRTGSLVYDDKPKINDPSSNEFGTGAHSSFVHAAPETNLKRDSNSPVNSPPPSPPLEHMKISFRPIDGFESSRLKLKYPEGVDHHESGIDIFPSFQLVPEPSSLKHDIGSDSDDDTFCRSNACMSDDFLNHLSDSNSEEWESEDSSESNYHAVYDSFHRISSAQTATSSPHCEGATHRSLQVGSRPADAITLESSPSFDLPVLDTKNPFSFQEMKLSLHEEVDATPFQEQMPQTPPLPPVQWRVSRLLADAAEINQYPKSDSLTWSFDTKLSGSSIPHLAKVNSAKVPSASEDPAAVTTEKLDDQKLDCQQQNSVVVNGRKTDEKGDFLHQIRAKSFNLKRIETSRSTNAPGTTASDKVTAILQKANEIRKAVASDDGEDDGWSDT